MRNIDWKAVQTRYEDATKVTPPRLVEQKEFNDLPAVTPEQVKTMMEASADVQLVDVRPKHYYSRSPDIAAGAVWRDPDHVPDWLSALKKEEPVVVFCAYGFHVGCNTARALRDAGYDARYMTGGHSAWKAIGGKVALRT